MRSLHDSTTNVDACFEIVGQLIAAGVKTKKKNSQGVTALELCPEVYQDGAQAIFSASDDALEEISAPTNNSSDSRDAVIQLLLNDKRDTCLCGAELASSHSPPTQPVTCNTCFTTLSSGSQFWYCVEGPNQVHEKGLFVCNFCSTQGKCKVTGVWVQAANVPEVEGKVIVTTEMIGHVAFVSNIGTLINYGTTASLPWLIAPTDVKTVSLGIGMRTQLRQSAKPRDGLSKSDVGEIVAIDASGNISIAFPNLPNLYECRAHEIAIHEGRGSLPIGCMVRIRPTIKQSRYQLGGITPAHNGILCEIHDDGDVYIDFGMERHWRGIVGEIQQISETSDARGIKVTASSGSNEMNVFDGMEATYWQSSSGPFPHSLIFELEEEANELHGIELFLAKEQHYFLPEIVEIHIGMTRTDFHKVSSKNISTMGWTSLCPLTTGKFKFIELRVLKCHQGGSACRINQVRIKTDKNVFPLVHSAWDPLKPPSTSELPELTDDMVGMLAEKLGIGSLPLDMQRDMVKSTLEQAKKDGLLPSTQKSSVQSGPSPMPRPDLSFPGNFGNPNTKPNFIPQQGSSWNASPSPSPSLLGSQGNSWGASPSPSPNSQGSLWNASPSPSPAPAPSPSPATNPTQSRVLPNPTPSTLTSSNPSQPAPVRTQHQESPVVAAPPPPPAPSAPTELVNPPSISDWKTKHVIAWLKNNDMEQIVEGFQREMVDGESLLEILAEEELLAELVPGKLAGRKVLRKIKELVEAFPPK
eukprot:c10098_g1_i2.p1 GENE.c10098_g1_i2~~c10098_g1_i2.p1  ORF type:complete len:753 (-),score=169.24 c10098_g1_i2:25-2283(-)